MARDIFVDTSGFYSLLVRRDAHHAAALQIVEKASRQKTLFVTTDYVVDETATLLKARKQTHLIPQFFSRIGLSAAIRVEWTDSDRFARTQALFLKHSDQDWSFTDCLSFVVMRQVELRDALTTDAHFEEAGFRQLLN